MDVKKNKNIFMKLLLFVFVSIFGFFLISNTFDTYAVDIHYDVQIIDLDLKVVNDNGLQVNTVKYYNSYSSQWVDMYSAYDGRVEWDKFRLYLTRVGYTYIPIHTSNGNNVVDGVGISFTFDGQYHHPIQLDKKIAYLIVHYNYTDTLTVRPYNLKGENVYFNNTYMQFDNYVINNVDDNQGLEHLALSYSLRNDTVFPTTDYLDGYDQARREYGHYDGNQYIPANEYGQLRYNDGYDEAKNYFSIVVDEIRYTASQWGYIQYYEGYENALDVEIDWFSWAFTFITLPMRIANIEVLPGIKIGYFALFTLLTGIVSWFFFIVGKGKGKK